MRRLGEAGQASGVPLRRACEGRRMGTEVAEILPVWGGWTLHVITSGRLWVRPYVCRALPVWRLYSYSYSYRVHGPSRAKGALV